MNFSRKPLALAVASALVVLALPAVAQNAANAVLPTMVITAPAEQATAVNAVSSSDLAVGKATTSDTASLLKDIPGVSLYGAGGLSSLPAIHGLADDRIRVKVDGMDLIASCPNHMNPALSYLDPNQIGELKTYAGIAPVSVGGDSIGGSIVAQTKAPEFALPGQGVLAKGELGAMYRSNNHAQSTSAGATLANEKFSISYSGAFAEADNYKAGGDFKRSAITGVAGHTLPLNEVGSSAYKTKNHNLTLAMKQDNHLFEAKIGYQDLPYQLYPNQRMDMLENKQNRFNLRYLGAFEWGKLEARAYHEKVTHYMDFGADKRFWYGYKSGPNGVNGTNDPVGYPCTIQATINGTTGCAAGMPMNTEGKTTGATVKADILLSEADLLRTGAELQTYRLDDWWSPSGANMQPGTFWNINNGKRDRAAVFGELERRFSTQWQGLVGLRYEQVSSNAGNVVGYSTSATAMGNQKVDADAFNARDRARTDHNWDMTALARHMHDANLDVDFGFAHKTRSPNLYERYVWSTWTMAAVMNNYVGDGNGYVGNVDLKPEKANTVSATIDYHAADRAWKVQATPYYTRVSDYIDAVPETRNATTWATNRFNVLRYTNQSARIYGLDLSGHAPLAKTSLGQFGVKGLLNYTNGKNRDTHDDLYNIMPLNAKLSLTHQTGGWDNALEVQGVKGKHNVSDVRNEIKTPGYSLVNLRGSYSWKQVRLDFGVENMFNKFYYLPLGGAYTGQGRTMSINPTDGTMAWGTAVPGMGRSIYTGVNIKF